MNELLHATVIKENNFAAGTRLTGYRRPGIGSDEFVVVRADDAPRSGNPVERLDCLTIENPHAVRVGDIFCMSWGYDQTNVNYFQVTRLTPKGAYMREIGAKSVPGTQGFMCETVQPAPGNFLPNSQWCGTGNFDTFRRINYDGKGGASTSFGRHYWARRVSATSSTYCSWYA